jgi:hypothetical protein
MTASGQSRWIDTLAPLVACPLHLQQRLKFAIAAK